MGLGHSGTGAQWDWDTMGLGHNETGAQWDYDTMGLGHSGTGTQRANARLVNNPDTRLAPFVLDFLLLLSLHCMGPCWSSLGGGGLDT